MSDRLAPSHPRQIEKWARNEKVLAGKYGVYQIAHRMSAFVFYHINRQTSNKKVEISHESMG